MNSFKKFCIGLGAFMLLCLIQVNVQAESLNAGERIILERLNPNIAASDQWLRVGPLGNSTLFLEQNNITYIYSVSLAGITLIVVNELAGLIIFREFVGEWRLKETRPLGPFHEYCPY
ncbi:MAG: hypothetical protein ACFB10_23890 [Salibacteraceae bacterium]